MKQEPGRRQPGIPFLQGGDDVKHPSDFGRLAARTNLRETQRPTSRLTA